MKTNVDKLMREKEITNKELATLTGLHVKTIREVRKGLTMTRYSTLRKIYKVLKEIKNND
jgi:DNA-binding helix-turn-helix protein